VRLIALRKANQTTSRRGRRGKKGKMKQKKRRAHRLQRGVEGEAQEAVVEDGAGVEDGVAGEAAEPS
jgi:hypothetical protein